MSAVRDKHIIVAGAGPAGLLAALALAREGLEVSLVGQTVPEAGGRTVALFQHSVHLLTELGAWKTLAPQAAPLRKLRIIDDTDNLFRWRPLTFAASEIGLDAFGWNVEAGALAASLRRLAETVPSIRLMDGVFEEPRFEAETASIAVKGQNGGKNLGRIEAALIVAADGQRSQLRQAAGIRAHLERLPQSALTAILAHALPHDDVSTEFHMRGGPCTLVPLPALIDATAAPPESRAFRYRSSLVWMLRQEEAQRLAALDDDAFALMVERRVHAILGKMRVAGPRGAVPLASLDVTRFHGQRLALVGEAAHAFPPIGAQGLNLGLRDAAALAALAGEALRDGHDVGGELLLEAYDRARRGDVTSRAGIVKAMNRSLLSPFLPVDFVRGLGMAALDLIPPLRHFVMREGVAPGFHS
ncbi:2-octaprenyl-6-methoxyphenol hydroxylase [Rhizobiales bacterium GAS113]|nr:2-octaprenyl-6-methoxyphenol hydroxylase [Rhizobiales bacterium GAS113]